MWKLESGKSLSQSCVTKENLKLEPHRENFMKFSVHGRAAKAQISTKISRSSGKWFYSPVQTHRSKVKKFGLKIR